MKTARNRFLLHILITISLFSVMLSVAAAQETGEELYEHAIFLKEGEGDLDGALALFKRIVDEFSSNRPLTAKALYQIGICQENLRPYLLKIGRGCRLDRTIGTDRHKRRRSKGSMGGMHDSEAG